MNRSIIIALAVALTASATPASARYARPLFTADDYPAEAIRKHHEGVVMFRATIGPNGRVTKCAIIKSSGHAELDAVTCTIVRKRGRFRPTLDSNGNPIEGFVESQANWFLPRQN